MKKSGRRKNDFTGPWLGERGFVNAMAADGGGGGLQVRRKPKIHRVGPNLGQLQASNWAFQSSC